MFNVCPKCGEYRPDKTINAVSSTAMCPECGHSHPFLMLPLFVITGASGSGKSTVCLKLASESVDCVVFEVDILWRDEFNDPDKYLEFRNLCLRVSKNIAQGGKPVVLCGSALPSQYQECVESRYFREIHYLALTCEPSELARRLRQRPEWRKSGADDCIERHVAFNQWFIDNSDGNDIKLVETTSGRIDETVRSVRQWITERI